MKIGGLRDGNLFCGRHGCPVDGVRRTGILAVALAGVFLVAVAAAEAMALVVVDGPRPVVRTALPTDATPRADPKVEKSPAPAPIRPVELETMLSVVREHRRGADEAWCETLAEVIYVESVLSDVDPLLITSMVAVESSFRSGAVSRVGAVGLMQLRPFVAEDVAQRQNIEWNGHEMLQAPHYNVRMGISYYKRLLDRFDGDATMALTAYNLGPTRVSRLVRNGSYTGSAYARRILRGYEALRKGQAWPTAANARSRS